jgi:hypothetical protein
MLSQIGGVVNPMTLLEFVNALLFKRMSMDIVDGLILALAVHSVCA